MAFSVTPPAPQAIDPRISLVYGTFALWAIVVGGIGVWLMAAYGFQSRDSKYYLLPWCVAAGLVIATPSIVLLYRRQFNPFHPLVFSAWSYFFPGYFVGGLLLASGYSQPYFLSFIQDESYNLPLTLVYAMLGYACLSIGFVLPVGRQFGRWMGSRLPSWDYRSSSVPIAGLILTTIGVWMTIVSFIQGLFGYQRPEETPIYSGLLYLVGLFWLVGSFLLWLYVFRSGPLLVRIAVVALLVFTAVGRASFEGNRGGLLGFVFVVGFAYALSGRKITGRQYALGGLLLVFALFAGMIYGTTFRRIRGTTEQTSVDQYTTTVTSTFENLSKQDPYELATDTLDTLAGRMDAASSLAVIVSNYEALAPDERTWGISNNIYVDSIVFFIPRVMWPEKPTGLSPEAYGTLYFSYGDNAFAMTPMGDLLRNFGPVGVPLGMILLGMIIRILYSTLVEVPTPQFWRAALYYMLFTSISFEGTYSAIIPMLFKVGAMVGLGLVITGVISTIPIFRFHRA